MAEAVIGSNSQGQSGEERTPSPLRFPTTQHVLAADADAGNGEPATRAARRRRERPARPFATASRRRWTRRWRRAGALIWEHQKGIGSDTVVDGSGIGEGADPEQEINRGGGGRLRSSKQQRAHLREEGVYALLCMHVMGIGKFLVRWPRLFWGQGRKDLGA